MDDGEPVRWCGRRGTVRDCIVELVRRRPGITKSEIRDELDLAWGTVAYHVDNMIEDESVRAMASGRCVGLFPADYRDNRMMWVSTLRKPETVRILRMFQTQREATILGVSESLGLSRRVARSRLFEMEAAGLLERRGKGRPRFALFPEIIPILHTIVY